MNCRLAVALAACAAIWAWPAASNAARVDLSLRVQTEANEEVEPVAPGVWNVPLGYDFKVVLSARVIDANTVMQDTPAGPRTYPLGLAGVVTSLMTSGVHVIDPALEPYEMVPGFAVWQSEDFTGWGSPWFNAVDKEGDGDLDPASLGFSIHGQLGRQPAENNLLIELGLDGFVDVTRGLYTASNTGTTSLHTLKMRERLFHPPIPETNTSVFAYGTNVPGMPFHLIHERVPATEASITINVVETADGWEGVGNVAVPEPGAALSVAGVVALLALRRRRKPR